MNGIRSIDMRRALKAAAVLERRLTSDPNVTGTGAGMRVRRGKYRRECCIVVHVSSKRPASRVAAARRIPGSFGGFSVDVVQTRAQQDGGAGPAAPPLAAGAVIRNGTIFGPPGSLGAILKPKPGLTLILSCHHVLYVTSPPTAVDIIEAREGDLTRPIAVTRRGAFNQHVDCALAEVDPSVESTVVVPVLNITPAGQRLPNAGEEVRKVGMNGPARGTVLGISNVLVNLAGGGTRKFLQQVRIGPLNHDPGSFWVGEGDSGCLWYGQDRRAVGLHMAGDLTIREVFANRMPVVIKALGL